MYNLVMSMGPNQEERKDIKIPFLERVSYAFSKTTKEFLKNPSEACFYFILVGIAISLFLHWPVKWELYALLTFTGALSLATNSLKENGS